MSLQTPYINQLPSWHRNRVKRQVKAPKLHFGDTGMACALLNASERVLEIEHSLRGQLVETFVYQELVRQATWLDHEIEFLHFRHWDRAEVDIVLEGKDRAVCGIEVKAGSTVRPSDFKGLQMLAEAAGDYFVSSVVLYDGEVTIGHRGFFYRANKAGLGACRLGTSFVVVHCAFQSLRGTHALRPDRRQAVGPVTNESCPPASRDKGSRAP